MMDKKTVWKIAVFVAIIALILIVGGALKTADMI